MLQKYISGNERVKTGKHMNWNYACSISLLVVHFDIEGFATDNDYKS